MNEDSVMRKRTETAIWGAVVVTSVAARAVAFGGLGSGRTDGYGRKRARPPTLVEMSVSQPVSQPREAAPPPTAKPAAKAEPKLAMTRPARVKASPASSAPVNAPQLAAQSPADFTGVTMTNDGPGTGWASATGNGDAMRGPVGRPGARVTHHDVDGDAGSRVSGPRTVGLGDLSHAPTAPDLTDVLARAYPPDARSKGLGGKAVVRARVMPDGQVRELALLSESAPEFGSACEQTLRGSRWSPPLDRNATPVSTFINYTCRFNVQ
jgi:TonB family protein